MCYIWLSKTIDVSFIHYKNKTLKMCYIWLSKTIDVSFIHYKNKTLKMLMYKGYIYSFTKSDITHFQCLIFVMYKGYIYSFTKSDITHFQCLIFVMYKGYIYSFLWYVHGGPLSYSETNPGGDFWSWKDNSRFWRSFFRTDYYQICYHSEHIKENYRCILYTIIHTNLISVTPEVR
jgi:hypothetical protein